MLDTSVVIAAERGQRDLADVLRVDDRPAIAAITVAELLVGVEFAAAAHRQARAHRTENLLATIPVEPYTEEVARSHAALLAATRAAGRPRGAFDLIIAATALATARTLISSDRPAFADLPGVSARILD
jgi:tRNA(fMet)-specific endonuclease VapC